MYAPWSRRILSDIALALASLVPWVATLWHGMVVRPIEWVSPSLFDAYLQIDVAWGVIASLIVSIVCGLIAVSFAAWRVSRPPTWTWDRPYSAWRTAKWFLALLVVSVALAGLAPAFLSIGIGKVAPAFYASGGDPSDAGWSQTVAICVVVGLSMIAVDILQQKRNSFTSISSWDQVVDRISGAVLASPDAETSAHPEQGVGSNQLADRGGQRGRTPRVPRR